MSKHTPGPYSLRGPDLLKHEIVILSPVKEDGWKTILAVIDTRNVGVERAEANARLMAAAPEMLEALKRVDALLCSGTLVRDISKDVNPDWALLLINLAQDLNMIKLAIYKAEGRSA